METVVRQRQLLVLADGDTLPAQNQAKGHLFEEFIANLMSLYGYEQPTTKNVNVNSAGIELDLSALHRMTHQRMIAECKCYSSDVGTPLLKAFYGALTSERLDSDGDLFGYFVAVPGLTPDASERARKIQAKDPYFRVLTSEDVLQYLEEQREIPSAAELRSRFVVDAPLSDDALVVTKEGLFIAALELDSQTRLATRVVVFPCRGDSVPSLVLRLLGDSRFAAGRPCEAATLRNAGTVVTRVAPVAEATVVEVAGSRSDFDHLPASPRFFVGRNRNVRQLDGILDATAEDDGSAQVVVFNAQSGWGKSSLALRITYAAQKRGGVGLCIDCRTADTAPFVAAAMRRAVSRAEQAGVLTAPAGASYASVPSILETLRSSTFASKRRPLCIFFDQFENVFRNEALTREFRDLALGVSELALPVVLGFAWKTDLVGFTETHPYQLRDDIRARATVLTLDPFRAHEISKLISRLQRACGQKLVRNLRERLREYSQGLPWLFKKLASHIQREIVSGVTQEQLLAEVLNVQSLFETDLRRLMPREVEALKGIARAAPTLATDAVESYGHSVVQTLIDQRLVVPVGERLDIYWDTFRDYLVLGGVPIQDSYILRLTPNTVTKLLKAIKEAGGSMATDEAAAVLKTSRIAVFNMARDLRQLGVLAPTEGVLRLVDEIASATDKSAALRARVANQLKRHRAYSLLSELTPAGGRVSVAAFTQALQREYPAVTAKSRTWSTYGAAFLYWFQYAGLAALERDDVIPGRDQALDADLFELKRAPRRKDIIAFPRSAPGPVLSFVEALFHGARPALRRDMAEADAVLLGLAAGSARTGYRLTEEGRAIAAASGQERQLLLRAALDRQDSFRIAAEMVAANAAVKPVAIGLAVATHYNVPWKASTATAPGKYLRAWLRAVGIQTALRTAPTPHPRLPFRATGSTE
jgi:hypothetical protein